MEAPVADNITHITIHCSDSAFGDVAIIRRWHTDKPPKGRGWADIGYHFVVMNGCRAHAGQYRQDDDGRIEYGRPLNAVGAHVAGHNKNNLGVCLIGVRTFTPRQITAALKYVRILMVSFDVPLEHVKGHYEYDSGKTCPNLDMDWFRRLISGDEPLPQERIG